MIQLTGDWVEVITPTLRLKVMHRQWLGYPAGSAFLQEALARLSGGSSAYQAARSVET